MPNYEHRMRQIVEEILVNYHSDLDIDLKYIEERGPGVYLWALRDTGTDIVKVEAPETTADLFDVRWFLAALRSNHTYYRINTELDQMRSITRTHAWEIVRALDRQDVKEIDIWASEIQPLPQQA